MKKASTELATKSLPASHVMAWECASWHACMKPAAHCEAAQHGMQRRPSGVQSMRSI